MRRTAIPLVALGLVGCALDPGRGFAHLAADLATSFRALDPALGRTLEAGWLKTSSSFALKLSELELGVRELRLLGAAPAASGSTASCSFDPQNPPAGCTLCHNDHCHCDGELRSYDELRAQVCGGGASTTSAVTVARLPVPGSQSLLGAGTRRVIASCLPSCELGAGSLDELQLSLERLRLRAVVRDESNANRLGGRQPSVVVDLPLGGAALSLKLANAGGAIAIGRDQPYHLALSVSLPVSEKLFDSVAWGGLSGEVIAIDGTQNGAAGEALLQGLTASVLTVQTSRGED